MKKLIPSLFVILTLNVEIINAQIFIDKYLTDPLTYTTIGTSANQVISPTDLDFKPYSNELWVINKSTESLGGTSVIFQNAGLSNQTSIYKKDANSWHFMSLPSAIAMGDNERFATSPNVRDANHKNTQISIFTGPSLWSTDTKIYAVIGADYAPAYNGSHIDMLHQSPYSMGIAHDSADKYWVFDGYNQNIVSYDFVMDHGPGEADHSQGKIHRYTEVAVMRDSLIPSHMVLDKSTGWLYICEPAKSRVLRMNTKTGIKKQNLTAINEVLTEYWEMQNVTWEVYIDTLLSKPTGIDFVDNRLLVSDYTNGDIVIYNTSGVSPVRMGKVQTGQSGIMGIKVGTDGKIWYVNNTQNKVVRINHSPVSNDASILSINSPTVSYYCGTTISPKITLLNNGTDTLKNVVINYVIGTGAVNGYNWTGSLLPSTSTQVTLPTTSIQSGYQRLSIYTSNPNGSIDKNTLNDKKTIYLKVSSIVYSLPFVENFQLAQFPPLNWIYNSPENWDLSNSVATTYHWSKITNAGGFGSSTSSARMENFKTGAGKITGQVDDLISPIIDCGNAVSVLTLTFNVAYARFDASTNDSLVVSVSTDCGNIWTKLYGKSGTALATAPDQTLTFTPTATQWRKETISLNSYIGKPNVKIKFHSKSANGNNLFIDDINLYSSSYTGINEIQASEFSIYPNPTNEYIFIQNENTNTIISQITIFDLLGKEIIRTQKLSVTDLQKIDISTVPTGQYFIQIQTDKGFFYRKIIKQ